MFKNWFRLHKRCLNCGMELEKDGAKFYFGTTSIGYVLSIILVIILVCILVAMDMLSMWIGVSIGIVGSIILCSLVYPLVLCWMIMLYYVVQTDELLINTPEQ